MSNKNNNTVSGLLLKAVRWLCQPLVNLLIEKGITYPQFCELLKGLYIETAEKSLKKKNIKPTLSSLFVQTGIHRKETKRVLEEVLTDEDVPFNVSSLGAQLVSRWIGLSEYQDIDGQPRPLIRVSEQQEAGFNNLVESVNKDVHPRAILDEWLRLGIVSLDDEDRVHLDKTAFVPDSSFEEKVFFFGRNIKDHIDTCVHNMLSGEPSKLERSVYFSALSEDSVQKLQILANKMALETLDRLNSEALQLKQNQVGNSDNENKLFRMRYGCYWFDNTEESDGGDGK